MPKVNQYRRPLVVSASELAKYGGKMVTTNNTADSANSLCNAREVSDSLGGGGAGEGVRSL